MESARRLWATGSFTSHAANLRGVSATSLSAPTSLAVDSLGNLFVIDSGNYRLLLFSKGSTVAICVFGQTSMSVANQYCPGGGFATVCSPAAVAVDFNDNVYVSSMQRSEISVLRTTSSEVQRTIPSVIGNGVKMAFDTLGGAYLAVPAAVGVYRMEPQDVGGAIFLAFGNIAVPFAGPVLNPARGLNNVRGIGLDAARSVLYVCDASNARVLVFQANVSNFAATVYGQPDFDSQMPKKTMAVFRGVVCMVQATLLSMTTVGCTS